MNEGRIEDDVGKLRYDVVKKLMKFHPQGTDMAYLVNQAAILIEFLNNGENPKKEKRKVDFYG